VGEMYLDDMNTFDYVQGKFILAKFTKESGSGLQISEGERFFREWEVALFV